jgi:hypothetical protein
MEERINVAIEIGGIRVSLDGPRDFVESEVRRLTTSLVSEQPTKSVSAMPSTILEAESEHDFIRAKNPSGHAEIVAVLAFLLTEHGQPEFSEDAIRRAYIRAKVRPPKVVAQAIRDAKNKRDFIEQGSSRGSYRLTHHGDRFVRFDLESKI